VLDDDVQLVVYLLGRVDHPAILDQKIHMVTSRFSLCTVPRYRNGQFCARSRLSRDCAET
jgi:hypothetical protein